LKCGEENLGHDDIVIIAVSNIDTIRSISQKLDDKGYNYFAFWDENDG